jgi:hypothetical protein
MFGLASGLLWMLQLVIFLLTLAAVIYVAVKIAGMAKASRRGKWITGVSVGVITFVVLNIPTWRSMIGRMYFDHLCKTEAGEFIYKTVDNVEGLYQMRPRDPSDYFDRMRAGDVPEDPFGHTNTEAQHPQFLFVSPPSHRYKFFENNLPAEVLEQTPLAPTITGTLEPNARYRRYHGRNHQLNRPMIEDHVSSLKSRYGFTWHGIVHEYDHLFGVYGGETTVVDLATNEILARRRGFIFRNGGGGICPSGKTDDSLYKFVSRVLIPPPLTTANEVPR